MSTRTLPRWARRRLAAMGVDPADVGRTFNRALPDIEDITIPTNADELEDLLSDSARMQRVFADKEKLKELIRNYAKTTLEVDTTIAKQVKAETDRVLREWLKDNEAEHLRKLNLRPGGPSPAAKQGSQYNKRAPGAAIDHLFDGTADYFKAIWHLNQDPEAQAKLAKLRNEYSSVIPSDGGFLIPESLRSTLLEVALERSVVRPRAMVVPMESLRVPFPTIDSASNAESVHGGIVAYWTEEGAQIPESSATFGRVVLEAKTLTAYAEVPNQLLSDSIISLAAFVDQKFPEALAWFEDRAFFSGTGAGEPLGFLNAPAAVEVSAESGQSAGTILWENIVKMFARMLPSSIDRAVWVAHIDTFPQLATMALNVGTGGTAVWLTNGAQGAPMTILGRPVIFTEKAKSVGTAGDINFVDFGYYLIGDRQAMSAMASPHYKFQNNMTAYRVVQRVDGRPWIQQAITPAEGSNTLSPFVKLETRS